MNDTDALLKRRREAVPQGVASIHDRFAMHASNAEVWDVDGQRYIDFAGGLGVLNTGHRHPKVMQAVAKQMESLTHTCFHVMPYASYVMLAERLNALVPGEQTKKTLLVNSGAEAVENAVKFARNYTNRSAVIAFHGGFHGRTHMSMALTGQIVPYKAGFGPFPAEIFHVPFPMELHGISVEDSLSAIDRLFNVDVEPERVAAIIVEPVQGESGFYIAPVEFLQGLRALCDQHGIVLIADEVQSGIGRTGKLFAIEHSGVIPDLMTLGKSLAGGFPLAAVTGSAEIMEAVPVGGVGGTYGGHPLACAAALAVLDVMHEEGLCERSLEIGERIRKRLADLADRVHQIGEVRNLGAMLALELFDDVECKRPATNLTRAVVDGAAERGLILLPCGTYGNAIRVLVPLSITDAVLDEGLDILEAELVRNTRNRSREGEGLIE